MVRRVTGVHGDAKKKGERGPESSRRGDPRTHELWQSLVFHCRQNQCIGIERADRTWILFAFITNALTCPQGTASIVSHSDFASPVSAALFCPSRLANLFVTDFLKFRTLRWGLWRAAATKNTGHNKRSKSVPSENNPMGVLDGVDNSRDL